MATDLSELLYCIQHGHLDDIKRLFSRHSKAVIESSWKIKFNDFLSPIHEAAEYGQDDILRYLLCPPNSYDINELTSVPSLFVFLFLSNYLM